MSHWIEVLSKNYDAIMASGESDKPIAVSHSTMICHVEIELNAAGKLIHAAAVPLTTVYGKTQKLVTTVVPTTHVSACRSSGAAPHPLCDILQYIAPNFFKPGKETASDEDDDEDAGEVKPAPTAESHNLFKKLLSTWIDVASARSHADAVEFLRGVQAYVETGSVVSDLIAAKVLPEDCTALTVVDKTFLSVEVKGARSVGVRWVVGGRKWNDDLIQASWGECYEEIQAAFFDTAVRLETGLCQATGEITAISNKHNSKLRHGGDFTRVISANNDANFVGRVSKNKNAIRVSYVASQKAHNMLEWLIKHNARTIGDDSQTTVCTWKNSSDKVPALDFNSPWEFDVADTSFGSVDAAAIRSAVAGKLAASFSDTDMIHQVSLRAYGQRGHMSLAYEEYNGSELRTALDSWYNRFSYPSYYDDETHLRAPTPKEMIDAAYGQNASSGGKADKLYAKEYAVLAQAIIGRAAFPRHFVSMAIARTMKLASLQHSKSYDDMNWNKMLWTTLAMINGTTNGESSVKLNKESTDFGYNLGRALAVYHKIEDYARFLKGSRAPSTHAENAVNQAATRPWAVYARLNATTKPWREALRSKRPGSAAFYEQLLVDIQGLLPEQSETANVRLDAAAVLSGYGHQLADLKFKKVENTDEEELTSDSDSV